MVALKGLPLSEVDGRPAVFPVNVLAKWQTLARDRDADYVGPPAFRDPKTFIRDHVGPWLAALGWERGRKIKLRSRQGAVYHPPEADPADEG